MSSVKFTPFSVYCCICKRQKEFIVMLTHREALEGKDLSKWVTFPTASPVVSLTGSVSPLGHCYNIAVTNYHRKLIANAVKECQYVKTTEATESWSMHNLMSTFMEISKKNYKTSTIFKA